MTFLIFDITLILLIMSVLCIVGTTLYKYIKKLNYLKTTIHTVKTDIRDMTSDDIHIHIKNDKGYNCSYSYRFNLLTINLPWVILFNQQQDHSSIKYDNVFYFTICHELGHRYYKDTSLLPITPKSKLISILREVRADLYAKRYIGLDGTAASNLLKEKVHICNYPESYKKIIDHPDWSDRIRYVKENNTYTQELENEIKDKYYKRVGLSKKKADNVSLFS